MARGLFGHSALLCNLFLSHLFYLLSHKDILLTDTKRRLTGTLTLPAGRSHAREKMQTQTGVKLTLVSHSRNDEQRFVKPENRIWSMKH